MLRKPTSAVDRARAIGEYDGTLREIIHALKYAGRRLACETARRTDADARSDVLRTSTALCPSLCIGAASISGASIRRARSRAISVRRSSTPWSRRRATRAQVELAADRRQGECCRRLSAARRLGFATDAIRGKNVMLIDDVSTTGATLEAVRSVLKESGASAVFRSHRRAESSPARRPNACPILIPSPHPLVPKASRALTAANTSSATSSIVRSPSTRTQSGLVACRW